MHNIISSYYQVKPPGLSPGTVLSKTSYGAYLTGQGLSETNDQIQEFLREAIRQSHYNHMPSRLRSSFVFETLDDATFFRDNFRAGDSVYRVQFVNRPSIVHRVCHMAWHSDFPNHELQAHTFWNKPPLYASNTELFAEEDTIVLAEV
jgi:hypothetical protein